MMKKTSVIAISFLLLSGASALAADNDSKCAKSETSVSKESSSDTKHCELHELAGKCCETEQSGIKCIDELITVVKAAKTSKKKKGKDEALEKTLAVLEKLKKNSEATVCAMETIKQRNKVLKGKVQKIKQELGVVESMFKTPATEPFMSGPYF